MELITKQGAAQSLLKGYKQTEVGLIPEDWNLSILNDLTDITRLAGYEYSTLWEETPNGEIIALRGFNIGQNKIIEKDFVNISDSLSKRLIRSRLFKNDVIYPCVGSIGNAVVIEENDKYHIQQNIAKITPKRDKVTPHYLAYYLMSEFGFKEIERFNGSSSQPNILVGSLRQYLVVTPTLTEQRAIATALSEVDALISSLDQLITKKKAIKQGAMQELLTGKTRLQGFAGSGRFKQTEVGVIPEEWIVKKFDDFGRFFKGKGIKKDEVRFEGNPCVRYGELYTRYENVIKETFSFISNDIADQSIKLKRGDLLFAGSGETKEDIGKSAVILRDDTYAGGDIVIFRAKEIDPIFLGFMSNSIPVSKQKAVNGQGDAVVHIYSAGISKIQIPLPPALTEQKAIATVLNDMDQAIERLESKKAKYQHIKQGMMQELLTGKTRLV